MSVEAFAKPYDGVAMVKSDCVTIYDFPGDESFFTSIDTHLIDATVTKGTEVTNSIAIAIAAEFTGLSMSVDGETKTFTTYETSGTLTKTITLDQYELAEHSSQKRYRFKITMFFILDAWGQEWNVGSQGTYDVKRKECEVEIMSEDYLTTDGVLDSTMGTIEVETVSKADNVETRHTRKREDLTQWSKDTLSKIGI
ncbi:hypothetical protein IW261DRAFT_1416014 [Armillaria novae-zelandiae]|uniref:Uncharacterized protein n=1 Tax=Armillaria novae-zelandiae TaxID=153914 RepID=A0AA39UGE1_9AGAR|nr:hypothetical protein IW261DRAFT_1416014 [Armillaria novae-zelandiae]